MCCSGLRGGASDDARSAAANGSIFSRADENVFSLLARAGPQREKLRSFLSGFERVFARGGGAGWAGWAGRRDGRVVCGNNRCGPEDSRPARRRALAPRATRVSAVGGGHPHH
ncbi:hypothetical protein FPJ27_35365 [Burkholderia sp. MS455]|nr:hypothetical protein FPJ27_35365 [Burkholderia sp. MS455]